MGGTSLAVVVDIPINRRSSADHEKLSKQHAEAVSCTPGTHAVLCRSSRSFMKDDAGRVTHGQVKVSFDETSRRLPSSSSCR